MKIKLLCVGKLREKYFAEASAEYEKRISRFHALEIVEIPAIPEPNNASDADRARLVREEGERILDKLPHNVYAVAMCVGAERMTSEGLAAFLDDQKMFGKDVSFIIGGSLGLSEEVIKYCEKRLSMSDMTFPHQLARVMLLEQLYRAMMISAGQTYHK